MSDIRSILLHLDSSARCAERTHVASRLATTFDAAVTGVYGVIPSLLRFPMGLDGTAGAVGLQEYDDACREKAHRLFCDTSATSGRMRWDEVPGDAIGGFGRRALYADLLVLGQRDEEDAAALDTPSDFVFSQVVAGGRPTLVVPFAGSFPVVGRTVLIAWKETREAARAVSAALPWLHKAERVHAIAYGEEGEASLHGLQHYLAEHQISFTPHQGDPRDVNVGDDLLSRASDIGADLLVMGCYGHSRAREWVLGGVSRTILRTMTVPVLMAH
jgi:nucleotide-binding universal stress UspA family protein